MIFPINKIFDLVYTDKTIPKPDKTNVNIHKVDAF